MVIKQAIMSIQYIQVQVQMCANLCNFVYSYVIQVHLPCVSKHYLADEEISKRLLNAEE